MQNREKIKKAFSGVHFSEMEKNLMTDRISEASLFAKERTGKNNMKMKRWQRVAMIVTGVLVLGGTVGAAAGTDMIRSWSNSFSDFKTAEKISQKASELGMNSFPDEIAGFEYSGGNTVHNTGEDEAGNSTGDWDELEAEYKNEDGKSIYISQSPVVEGKDDQQHTDEVVIDGTTVLYDCDEYLFLPPDMEGKTDQKLLDREASDDHFFISYGSDEPETKFFKNASFVIGDIRYLIFSYDEVSEDELISVVRELIQK